MSVPIKDTALFNGERITIASIVELPLVFRCKKSITPGICHFFFPPHPPSTLYKSKMSSVSNSSQASHRFWKLVDRVEWWPWMGTSNIDVRNSEKSWDEQKDELYWATVSTSRTGLALQPSTGCIHALTIFLGPFLLFADFMLFLQGYNRLYKIVCRGRKGHSKVQHAHQPCTYSSSLKLCCLGCRDRTAKELPVGPIWWDGRIPIGKQQ